MQEHRTIFKALQTNPRLPDHRHRDGSRDHLGVSIVICCHNSATLLPATISRLRRQRAIDVNWEVLLIDNASTDGTAQVARKCWGDDPPTQMRIIHEARLGLCYARERAFEEAKYEILSFVDDDNWVTDEWVRTVSECMSADSGLGAMGSINTAVADVSFPDWFSRYCHYYAAWAYRERPTVPTWALSGAGMSIRKSVWEKLREDGFRFSLTGRSGNRLSSSEDLEAGCAIQLAGWKVRVEHRLKLQHYMTCKRLQWSYLRKLLRAIGEASVYLDAYLLVDQSERINLTNRLRLCWWTRLAKESWFLICWPRFKALIRSLFHEMEGDDEVAQIELVLGRLIGLLRLRSHYGQLRRTVARAPWRRLDSLAWQRIINDPSYELGGL